MSSWQELDAELSAWAAAGRKASFWWRDDDASAPSPALDRLLAQAESAAVPLALAVIPAQAEAALARRLAEARAHVQVLQHGYSHANHAPPGKKKMELGPERPGVAICEELSHGRAILSQLFATRALPVLVPPWNRLWEGLVPDLAPLGFRGLSRHGARVTRTPVEGINECNTHVDLLRWRPTRGFVGEAEALTVLIGHMRARRGVPSAARFASGADPAEPTGLLSHHLVMDEAAWGFLARLLDRLRGHDAVAWPCAEEIFALGGRP